MNNEVLKQTVLETAGNGRMPFDGAFDIVRRLDGGPGAGEVANRVKVGITICQLGCFREPEESGSFGGERVYVDRLNEMMDDYDKRCGWNRGDWAAEAAWPEELDLRDVADELLELGKLG